MTDYSFNDAVTQVHYRRLKKMLYNWLAVALILSPWILAAAVMRSCEHQDNRPELAIGAVAKEAHRRATIEYSH